MPHHIRLLFLCVIAWGLALPSVWGNEQDFQINLDATPALPIASILPTQEYNLDFSMGLSNWKKAVSQNGDAECVQDGSASSVRVTLAEGTQYRIYQDISTLYFQKGESYIATCRIRPQTNQMPFKPYEGGGPGICFSFYTPDWKTSSSMCASSSNGHEVQGEWLTVESRPFTVPDWTAAITLFAGIFYWENHQSIVADITDIKVFPTNTMLNIQMSAHQPIRQIRVMNDNDDILYTSPVYQGDSRSISYQMRVTTPHRYTVLGILEDGTVASKTYPAN